MGWGFFETSAKVGTNVSEAYTELARRVISGRKKPSAREPDPSETRRKKFSFTNVVSPSSSKCKIM